MSTLRSGPDGGERGRLRLAILVAIGLLAILCGAVVAMLVSDGSPSDGPRALGALAVLVGVLVAVWKLWRTPEAADVEPAPWTDEGALVDEAPERIPDETEISGTGLTTAIDRAATQARVDRTVQDGIAEVRPMLRSTLLEAMVEGGEDYDAAKAALATGTWTEDREAAAVLDDSVPPPDRSLRRRLWAWLYPGRAVRRRVGRAVAAVAAAADDALPPVVGQRAPRPMPITYPTAEELRETDDGDGRSRVHPADAPRCSDSDRNQTAGNRPPGPGPGFETADGGDGSEGSHGSDGTDEAPDGEWPTADGGAD